jgi:hypothetical protein
MLCPQFYPMKNQFRQHWWLLAVLILLPFPGADAQENRASNGSLRGTVQNQNREPLAKVKVRAINRHTDKLEAEVETDYRGQFTLSLPAGRYALDFYSPDYQKATIPVVEIEMGKDKQLNRSVRLERVKVFAVIRGAVFNDQGYLLPGARVALERIPFQSEPVESLRESAVTNESGEFAFRLPGRPARYRLTATAQGLKPGSITVDVGGAERRNVSISLEREQ